ncbi:MAG: tripartite tricarboxylate transporter substrate binding protein [Betaproteobacteria bacterium]|nr:tripartite tricarboxylate transporter substrate binding protein [Betaproteobacteria bacterium]MBI2960420.1 tripartite tricarboxylate transporter substrate binding protein [Betaproteobacteria bacterium]
MMYSSRLLPIAVFFGLGACGALAQTYPSKPVRIVVPVAAGGPIDITARLISPKLAEAWKQPVLVDNQAGAAEQIGANAVARAAPDGYTLLLCSDSLPIGPALSNKIPFNAAKDFIPVTQLIASPAILVVAPKLPATSTAELIALAKSKPGSLNYGHTGVGASLHLGMEQFKLSARIDILGIPYKGVAPISKALMADEVDMAVMPLSTSVASVKAGRLRALTVLGPRRLPALPDVPTVAETGVADVDAFSWHAIFAPAKTPREIVDQIRRDAVNALNSAEVRDRLLAMGQVLVGSTPEEFDIKFKADLERFARIVKQARIPVQN